MFPTEILATDMFVNWIDFLDSTSLINELMYGLLFDCLFRRVKKSSISFIDLLKT